MNEDVLRPVRIVRNQVARVGLEGDVAAVRAHGGLGARAVRLRARARATDQRGLTGLDVVDEDVGLAVRVTVDEISRPGLESDETAVGADDGIGARTVSARNPDRRSGAAIMKKYIFAVIRISRY